MDPIENIRRMLDKGYFNPDPQQESDVLRGWCVVLLEEIDRARKIEDAAISWGASATPEIEGKRANVLIRALESNPRPDGQK